MPEDGNYVLREIHEHICVNHFGAQDWTLKLYDKDIIGPLCIMMPLNLFILVIIIKYVEIFLENLLNFDFFS